MTSPSPSTRRTPLIFPSRGKLEAVPQAARPWRILIADDEPDVHTVTRMLLKDFVFEGRGLEFLSAESAEQTRAIMRNTRDIAVVLLDVVMESEQAGLEVVRTIRHELGNTNVRIILRTGQPGYAPETQVVEEFDINDYREKTELTAQKLTTALMSALRAYRDIRNLDHSRRGLEQIVGSSAPLFEHQSIPRFAAAMLDQFKALLGQGGRRLVISGFAALRTAKGLEGLAGIGVYAEWGSSLRLAEALPVELRERLAQATQERTPIFGARDIVACFPTSTGAVHLVYLESSQQFEDVDIRLLRVFAANIGVAFEKVCLNRELTETSSEIVQTLSDVVETRSVDTSRHTLRVGKTACLLGQKLGLPESSLNLLRLVAPMHDLGKVGIPDALLNKPGKLTAEEYACVKAHTTIGYNILRGSKRRLLTAAAQVCLQHHERWDGTGYPQGLKGTEIDIVARIVALADVFDAVSNDRPYKRRWPPEQVREYIASERGCQFDPDLVDLFLADFDAFVALEREERDDLEIT